MAGMKDTRVLREAVSLKVHTEADRQAREVPGQRMQEALEIRSPEGSDQQIQEEAVLRIFVADRLLQQEDLDQRMQEAVNRQENDTANRQENDTANRQENDTASRQ